MLIHSLKVFCDQKLYGLKEYFSRKIKKNPKYKDEVDN